ncbi:MAG: hypothetical protein ACLGHC_01805 [Alphaproteobacteria bacterium]
MDNFSRRVRSKAVAVHEAGHLFVNLALQPAPFIDAVWIRRNDQGHWEGCVDYVHRFQWAISAVPMNGTPDAVERWEAAKRENARRELLVSLAGPIAEIRWRTRGRWSANLSAKSNATACLDMGAAASSDFGYAKRFIEWLGYPDPQQAFVDAWLEAEEIVHQHWQAIVAVGSLLKERERLDAETLYDLPEVISAREQAWATETATAT